MLYSNVFTGLVNITYWIYVKEFLKDLVFDHPRRRPSSNRRRVLPDCWDRQIVFILTSLPKSVFIY